MLSGLSSTGQQPSIAAAPGFNPAATPSLFGTPGVQHTASPSSTPNFRTSFDSGLLSALAAAGRPAQDSAAAGAAEAASGAFRFFTPAAGTSTGPLGLFGPQTPQGAAAGQQLFGGMAAQGVTAQVSHTAAGAFSFAPNPFAQQATPPTPTAGTGVGVFAGAAAAPYTFPSGFDVAAASQAAQQQQLFLQQQSHMQQQLQMLRSSVWSGAPAATPTAAAAGGGSPLTFTVGWYVPRPATRKNNRRRQQQRQNIRWRR